MHLGKLTAHQLFHKVHNQLQSLCFCDCLSSEAHVVRRTESLLLQSAKEYAAGNLLSVGFGSAETSPCS